LGIKFTIFIVYWFLHYKDATVFGLPTQNKMLCLLFLGEQAIDIWMIWNSLGLTICINASKFSFKNVLLQTLSMTVKIKTLSSALSNKKESNFSHVEKIILSNDVLFNKPQHDVMLF